MECRPYLVMVSRFREPDPDGYIGPWQVDIRLALGFQCLRACLRGQFAPSLEWLEPHPAYAIGTRAVRRISGFKILRLVRLAADDGPSDEEEVCLC